MAGHDGGICEFRNITALGIKWDTRTFAIFDVIYQAAWQNNSITDEMH